MATFEERVFISEFNVQPSGSIGVRKTTEVLKDGEVISQTYWRCVLSVNDPQAQEVLGAEPWYLNLAHDAWNTLPPPVEEAA